MSISSHCEVSFMGLAAAAVQFRLSPCSDCFAVLARVDTQPFTPAASNPWIWGKSLFLGLIDMCLPWLCQTNKSNFILSPDPGTPDTNGIFKKLSCLEVSASSLASIYQTCPPNSVCLMKQQCPPIGQPTSPCWLEAAASLQLVPTLGLWRKDMVWSFYFMRQINHTYPTSSSAFLVSGTPPRIHQCHLSNSFKCKYSTLSVSSSALSQKFLGNCTELR